MKIRPARVTGGPVCVCVCSPRGTWLAWLDENQVLNKSAELNSYC